MREFLIVLLACVLGLQTVAGQRKFQYIGAEKGLPDGEITSLMTDHRGTLWIGTNAGLARYDGHSVVTVADNNVSDIYEDGDHNLWIHSGDKFFRYLRRDHRMDDATEAFFTSVGIDATPKKALFTDSSDRLWVITARHLYCYDFGRKKLRAMAPTQPRWTHAEHVSFAEDGRHIYILAGPGPVLWSVDKESGAVRSVRIPAELVSSRPGIYADSRGMLWIYSTLSEKLYRMSGGAWAEVFLPADGDMIPQQEKYGYRAKLTCYGQGADGEPSDAWNSATTTVAGGKTGTYTVTFTTNEPRKYGQVYILDIENFATAYPNAFVRIDAIKADGAEVQFDANKFYYGDIEGGGNFRVEMANIWGRGHNESFNGLADTPFHPGGGETTAETALAFNSTFEVTFTVVSLDTDLSFNVKQTAVGLNPGWSQPGNWGKEYPGALKIVHEEFRYKVANEGNLAMKLEASECDGTPANGAVNLVDVVGIRSFFPAFAADLVSVTNDGNDVPFIASNLITGDIEGNGNFRIELHNIWGAGTAANPAFGGSTVIEGNNCVTSLGFTESTIYTIGNFTGNLFSRPW
ncbi:MAG: hypothetical protein J6K19_02560 [Prevotella sp.]|nr:hypothetical protein [Prevotella sp.]